VSAQRLSFAPDIPTIAETFAGYDLASGRHRRARRHAARDREQAACLDQQGAGHARRGEAAHGRHRAASSKSPEDFAAFIRSQADTRAKVIQAVGMKLD
jgi:tripartite-type tricarboxylate transporter receptor subunit TctC